MPEILLTQGLSTQVDDRDYAYLNQWKWYAAKDSNGNTYYAVRNSNCRDNPDGKQHQIRMHNIIMPPIKGFKNDHIDHNGLNNQRENLRQASNSQNNMNCTSKSSTRYRGVSYDKRNNTFGAHITINGRLKHLGTFDDPIKAAKKYDRYALKYRGEFAILNFKYNGI